jgi:hypothetical protein
MIVPVIVPLKTALLCEFQIPNIDALIFVGSFCGEPGVTRPFNNISINADESFHAFYFLICALTDTAACSR